MRPWSRRIVIAMTCAVIAVVAPPFAAHAQQSTEVLLRDAVAQLPLREENREGYERDKFPHWVDADRDGCSTRAEVLLEEAVEPPEITGRCSLSGGHWYSAYDNVWVDDPRGLDIDHMVPLAEAWDSGAYDWTRERRRAFANDLDDPRALWAVTARSNRGKADQDPSTWLPPHEPAVCRYITAWTVVKVRWGLAVDPAEHDALSALAADCPDKLITVTPA